MIKDEELHALKEMAFSEVTKISSQDGLPELHRELLNLGSKEVILTALADEMPMDAGDNLFLKEYQRQDFERHRKGLK